MARIHVELSIEGTSPLLCNRFSDEAAGSSTGGTRAAQPTDKGTPLEQAEHKLYIGHNKLPMIPQPNVFRSIIDGGTYFKVGKSKVTTQKSSLIPACLEIEGIEIPLLHSQPWTVDTRAVRIPSTGGRILCHRPVFHDWKLSFALTLDTDVLPLRLLREIVDAAGKRIGLGDFRPACKGPFGKYVVTSWVVEEPHRANGARRDAVGVA